MTRINVCTLFILSCSYFLSAPNAHAVAHIEETPVVKGRAPGDARKFAIPTGIREDLAKLVGTAKATEIENAIYKIFADDDKGKTAEIGKAVQNILNRAGKGVNKNILISLLDNCEIGFSKQTRDLIRAKRTVGGAKNADDDVKAYSVVNLEKLIQNEKQAEEFWKFIAPPKNKLTREEQIPLILEKAKELGLNHNTAVGILFSPEGLKQWWGGKKGPNAAQFTNLIPVANEESCKVGNESLKTELEARWGKHPGIAALLKDEAKTKTLIENLRALQLADMPGKIEDLHDAVANIYRLMTDPTNTPPINFYWVMNLLTNSRAQEEPRYLGLNFGDDKIAEIKGEIEHTVVQQLSQRPGKGLAPADEKNFHQKMAKLLNADAPREKFFKGIGNLQSVAPIALANNDPAATKAFEAGYQSLKAAGLTPKQISYLTSQPGMGVNDQDPKAGQTHLDRLIRFDDIKEQIRKDHPENLKTLASKFSEEKILNIAAAVRDPKANPATIEEQAKAFHELVRGTKDGNVYEALALMAKGRDAKSVLGKDQAKTGKFRQSVHRLQKEAIEQWVATDAKLNDTFEKTKGLKARLDVVRGGKDYEATKFEDGTPWELNARALVNQARANAEVAKLVFRLLEKGYFPPAHDAAFRRLLNEEGNAVKGADMVKTVVPTPVLPKAGVIPEKDAAKVLPMVQPKDGHGQPIVQDKMEPKEKVVITPAPLVKVGDPTPKVAEKQPEPTKVIPGPLSGPDPKAPVVVAPTAFEKFASDKLGGVIFSKIGPALAELIKAENAPTSPAFLKNAVMVLRTLREHTIPNATIAELLAQTPFPAADAQTRRDAITALNNTVFATDQSFNGIGQRLKGLPDSDLLPLYKTLTDRVDNKATPMTEIEKTSLRALDAILVSRMQKLGKDNAFTKEATPLLQKRLDQVNARLKGEISGNGEAAFDRGTKWMAESALGQGFGFSADGQSFVGPDGQTYTAQPTTVGWNGIGTQTVFSKDGGRSGYLVAAGGDNTGRNKDGIYQFSGNELGRVGADGTSRVGTVDENGNVIFHQPTAGLFGTRNFPKLKANQADGGTFDFTKLNPQLRLQALNGWANPEGNVEQKGAWLKAVMGGLHDPLPTEPFVIPPAVVEKQLVTPEKTPPTPEKTAVGRLTPEETKLVQASIGKCLSCHEPGGGGDASEKNFDDLELRKKIAVYVLNYNGVKSMAKKLAEFRTGITPELTQAMKKWQDLNYPKVETEAPGKHHHGSLRPTAGEESEIRAFAGRFLGEEQSGGRQASMANPLESTLASRLDERRRLEVTLFCGRPLSKNCGIFDRRIANLRNEKFRRSETPDVDNQPSERTENDDYRDVTVPA